MKTIKNFLLKKRKILKSKAGFSLVELLVVVGIMGVISALAIPAYNKYNAKTNEAGAKAEAKTILRAVQTCLANGDSVSDCETGNVNNTLSKTCETDPTKAVGTTHQKATGATDHKCFLFINSAGTQACALTNIKGKFYCMDTSGNSSDSKYCEHDGTGTAKGTCA